MRRWTAVLAGAAFVGGCYHATVDLASTPQASAVTQQGQAASGQTIDIWAHSWVYGLVPPSTVDATARCPNGASKVETQMSFVNGLVGAITWGIYTPMTISVTCR